MNKRIEHSKFGIFSTILAIGIWIYLAVIFLFFFGCISCANFLEHTFFKDSGFGGLGVALILVIILFVVIPVGGHILGAIFGIVGCFAKNKKRIFSVTGLILNILPFFGGLILLLVW
jgi:hypothetical protein